MSIYYLLLLLLQVSWLNPLAAPAYLKPFLAASEPTASQTSSSEAIREDAQVDGPSEVQLMDVCMCLYIMKQSMQNGSATISFYYHHIHTYNSVLAHCIYLN
jgi:hypothetical protein